MGIGPQEIQWLKEPFMCGGGFLCVAVSVLAVAGVLWVTLRGKRSGDEAALRREVARLQAEVDRLKNDV